MTIVSNIKTLCAAREITSGYQLQHRLGLKSPTVAQSLFDETFTRLSLATIGKLCAGLDCQPGDLFRVEADAAPEPAPKKGKRR